MMRTETLRRLPVGAEPVPGGGVSFRVWAPKRRRVEVVLEGGPALPLSAESGGYFAGAAPEAGPGARYRFRLDGVGAFPDPASRRQPDGPHGPSEVVDPSFAWSDQAWPGLSLRGAVLYELHVGTFTPQGTWAAAAKRLPALKELGVTAVEVMPVAEFPGAFGWGYDGVDLFAPSRLYGSPEDLRRFVDSAHRAGLGVLLDVVYNHFGPDGWYLGQFSDAYLSSVKTEWGAAVNYDGPGCGPVREFVRANAAYWVSEFHVDGLRLDATQQIFDSSRVHILSELAEAARAAAAPRRILVIAENEPGDARLVRPPAAGGLGLDALWNEDFHHAAGAVMTGRREAYLHDYAGHARELAAAVRWGPLYQGQWYPWQKQRRGSPAFDVAPERFVTFLENHDQAANSRDGRRLPDLTSGARYRAMAAVWLLAPATPLFFQGQEAGTRRPFLYFADHHPELAKLVREGRAQFLQQFRSCVGGPDLPDPASPSTFASCRLSDSDLEAEPGLRLLHRDLLRLRREDPVFRAQRSDWLERAVLSDHALLLRYMGGPLGDRMIVANLGAEGSFEPASEPLLAPPAGMTWKMSWSSDDPAYGGPGARSPVDESQRWYLPGECAVVLEARHGA